jgi:hypothetical protein
MTFGPAQAGPFFVDVSSDIRLADRRELAHVPEKWEPVFR